MPLSAGMTAFAPGCRRATWLRWCSAIGDAGWTSSRPSESLTPVRRICPRPSHRRSRPCAPCFRRAPASGLLRWPLGGRGSDRRPKGDPADPLSGSELLEKLENAAAGRLPARHDQAALRRLPTLDDQPPHIGCIISQLCLCPKQQGGRRHEVPGPNATAHPEHAPILGPPSGGVPGLAPPPTHGTLTREIRASLHSGTHVDAASLYDPAGKNIDDLPLEGFCGSGMVIDVSDLGDWGRSLQRSSTSARLRSAPGTSSPCGRAGLSTTRPTSSATSSSHQDSTGRGLTGW